MPRTIVITEEDTSQYTIETGDYSLVYFMPETDDLGYDGTIDLRNPLTLWNIISILKDKASLFRNKKPEKTGSGK